jgi:hypothetical protein
MIAAEVEIVTDVGSTFKPIETRVVRMIEGDFKGSTIRIEPTYWSSCDSLPYPGSRGILVGRVLSSTGDVLIVDPVRALSQRQLKEQSAAQTFVPH